MQSAARKYARGMTLIELMIVVVIASILVSIAVPSYISQMRRGPARRGQDRRPRSGRSRGALFQHQHQRGELFADRRRIWATPLLPANLPSGYYNLSVCGVGPGMAAACPPSTQAAPAFTVTATADQCTGRGPQCTSFSVDNTGRQWATDSTGADNTVYCWGN